MSKGRPGNVSICEGCGEQIVFLAHERSGKLSPITTAAYPQGNVIELPDFKYRILGEAEARAHKAKSSQPLKLNHFANCPHAKDFERR